MAKSSSILSFLSKKMEFKDTFPLLTGQLTPSVTFLIPTPILTKDSRKENPNSLTKQFKIHLENQITSLLKRTGLVSSSLNVNNKSHHEGKNIKKGLFLLYPAKFLIIVPETVNIDLNTLLFSLNPSSNISSITEDFENVISKLYKLCSKSLESSKRILNNIKENLTKPSDWIRITDILQQLIFNKNDSKLIDFKPYIDSLSKFSSLLCLKSLSTIRKIYFKDLTDIYTKSQHILHKDKALSYFRMIVSGSSVDDYAKNLEKEFDDHYNNHKQCSAISFNGKNCINPANNDLSFCNSHDSDFKYYSSCLCGQKYNIFKVPFEYSSEYIFESKCCKSFKSTNVISSDYSGQFLIYYLGNNNKYDPQKGLQYECYHNHNKFLFLWDFNILGSSEIISFQERFCKNNKLSKNYSPENEINNILFSISSLNDIISSHISLESQLELENKFNDNLITTPSVTQLFKKVSEQRGTVSCFIGIEYECANGSRFLLSCHNILSYSGIIDNTKSTNRYFGNVFPPRDLPILVSCKCEKKNCVAQIQRIYIVTPPPPICLSIRPIIHSPLLNISLGPKIPTILPSSSFISQKFPKFYININTGKTFTSEQMNSFYLSKNIISMYKPPLSPL